MNDTLERGADLALNGPRRIMEVSVNWKMSAPEAVMLGAFCMLTDGQYHYVSSRRGEEGNVMLFPYAELESEVLQDHASRKILRFDVGKLGAEGFQSLIFATSQTPWSDLNVSVKISKPDGRLVTFRLNHPLDAPVLAIGRIGWPSSPPMITLTETYHRSTEDMLRAYDWPVS